MPRTPITPHSCMLRIQQGPQWGKTQNACDNIKNTVSATGWRKTPQRGDTLSMLPKDTHCQPSIGFTTQCSIKVFYHTTVPISPRISKDLAGHKPSIANECGCHSDMLMDLDNTMTGTRTRSKGWTPDSPVIPPARKILFTTDNM